MRSVRSAGKEKLTSYFKPMLATLADSPFDNTDWIYEIKWDGYRAIAEVQNSEVKLYSRNGLSFKTLYPTVAQALQKMRKDVVLDGEIVFINESGKPDFQKLQQYGETKRGHLIYYVFDCLQINGKSITHLPLIDRKRLLKDLLPKSDTIKFADHLQGNGIEFFNTAAAMDLEGIIAKRGSSIYTPGKRSPDWLKIKHHNIQEAIIAGYTEPRGSRSYFGALILAIRKNNILTYIGHTGTGFTQAILKDVYAKLQSLTRSDSPFKTKVPVNTKVTWVEPKLVCNIKFTEVTQGGILRHPVFMGLRIDKVGKEVDHLEVATSALPRKSSKQKPSKKGKILS
jgi:bifunctional non-homologous end joining protein LigD